MTQARARDACPTSACDAALGRMGTPTASDSCLPTAPRARPLDARAAGSDAAVACLWGDSK
eukprot:CAMPEP_0171592736 /NCGR_PEP_ID=MMETSP0961-20121227/17048_1 /TAXON_ID=87120 /ORGANISM="Aurantiochytrium limacinum, Strain ATCCMYA-1381" /LENGTH=60 /DNA_ID=CAMNT_0012153135 /DNA_START=1017 /DNA_END=1196 /DNA_ORIENTATION=-